MIEVLLRTVHGSHLYGLAHAGSDYDFYEVLPSPAVKISGRLRNKHSIVGKLDKSEVVFSTFVEQCFAGSPQALEALYSEKTEVDELSFFRASFRVGAVIFASYQRAIQQCVQVGDFKRRRHAIRLALNLRSLAYAGSFNPTLSSEEISLANSAAGSPDAEFRGVLQSISLVPIVF